MVGSARRPSGLTQASSMLGREPAVRGRCRRMHLPPDPRHGPVRPSWSLQGGTRKIWAGFRFPCRLRPLLHVCECRWRQKSGTGLSHSPSVLPSLHPNACSDHVLPFEEVDTAGKGKKKKKTPQITTMRTRGGGFHIWAAERVSCISIE